MAGVAAWVSWRNRLLASTTFQRAAEKFWPTRWVARRSARRLFDLIGGFVSSQVLAACLELDLLEALKPGPLTAAELADRAALRPDRAALLAEAACTVGLLQRGSGDSYQLGELGAMLLGNPSLTEMIRHHAVFYRDLADPVRLLRAEKPATELASYWAYAGADAAGESVAAADAEAYTQLMAATQPMVSRQVLSTFSFAGVQHVMDVGGGSGAFLSAVAGQYKRPELSLVDLPGVCSLARTQLSKTGLSERIAVRPADFLHDQLPRGADLVTLVRIVHDHDDDAVRTLFRRIFAALPAGGRLLIAEPMLATPSAPLFGSVYFSFYLLAMGSGRPRAPEVIKALLTEAGFSDCTLLKTPVPLVAQVLVATANKA